MADEPQGGLDRRDLLAASVATASALVATVGGAAARPAAAVAILDTLRSHYTRVRWSRPDMSQQPVSWKSPYFAQHMHNDVVGLKQISE